MLIDVPDGHVVVDPTDLVNVTQIAKELDVASRQVVGNWLWRYPDFPKPLISTPAVRLYSMRAVRAWFAEATA